VARSIETRQASCAMPPRGPRITTPSARRISTHRHIVPRPRSRPTRLIGPRWRITIKRCRRGHPGIQGVAIVSDRVYLARIFYARARVSGFPDSLAAPDHRTTRERRGSDEAYVAGGVPARSRPGLRRGAPRLGGAPGPAAARACCRPHGAAARAQGGGHGTSGGRRGDLRRPRAIAAAGRGPRGGGDRGRGGA